MSVSIPQTTNTNSMTYLITIVNELANAMSGVAVTTNSNTSVGNAAITGTFTANVVNSAVVSIVNGGNSVTINAPTYTQSSNNQYYLNANGSWSPVYEPYEQQLTTSGTSLQVIDSFLMASFNAAEYFVSVKDLNANNYYATKIIIMHDTLNSYITEYGSITSNSYMGPFTASANSTSLILNFTPVSSSTFVKLSRTIV